MRRQPSGQAMIEFVIATLLVVIVLAGFFQFFDIAMARGNLLEPLRGDTGKKALKQSDVSYMPDYITSWDDGGDGYRHTGDDKSHKGSAASTLGAGVIEHSVADQGDWRYADGIDSSIPLLRSGVSATALGFVHESRRQEIELLPIMRNWIIGRETMTIGGDLWMPGMNIRGADDD